MIFGGILNRDKTNFPSGKSLLFQDDDRRTGE